MGSVFLRSLLVLNVGPIYFTGLGDNLYLSCLLKEESFVTRLSRAAKMCGVLNLTIILQGTYNILKIENNPLQN